MRRERRREKTPFDWLTLFVRQQWPVALCPSSPILLLRLLLHFFFPLSSCLFFFLLFSLPSCAFIHVFHHSSSSFSFRSPVQRSLPLRLAIDNSACMCVYVCVFQFRGFFCVFFKSTAPFGRLKARSIQYSSVQCWQCSLGVPSLSLSPVYLTPQCCPFRRQFDWSDTCLLVCRHSLPV